MNYEGVTTVIETESIEKLRHIVESQQGRLLSNEEIADFANDLVVFFKALSSEDAEHE